MPTYPGWHPPQSSRKKLQCGRKDLPYKRKQCQFTREQLQLRRKQLPFVTTWEILLRELHLSVSLLGRRSPVRYLLYESPLYGYNNRYIIVKYEQHSGGHTELYGVVVDPSMLLPLSQPRFMPSPGRSHAFDLVCELGLSSAGVECWGSRVVSRSCMNCG